MADAATLLTEWKKYRDENPLQKPSKLQTRKLAMGAIPLGDIKGKNEDEYLKEQMHQKYAEQQRIAKEAALKEWKNYRDENPLQKPSKLTLTKEEIQKKTSKDIWDKYGPLKTLDVKKVEDIKAASKGVSEVALTNGVTSPPSQGVNDTGLMDIINTLISQKEQVHGIGDASINEFEKQIADLKEQIAQAQESSDAAKTEELNNKIEELNAQKAQAQASKETDIKELERQISELKKPEQSGLSQIPIKIIAAVGGAILIVILLIAVILRGKK
jgi:polyhydroxyalkanoate synthesis regulator phasin